MPSPATPKDRMGFVTLNVPSSAKVSPLTVVLRASPWQTVADRAAGPNPGQAHLTPLKHDRGFTRYRVVLDDVPPVDDDRDVDLTFLDGNDRNIMSIIERRATRDDPSIEADVKDGVPIRRVILQSQAVDRARFENVHLLPNP